MQCQYCGFENLPGITECINCNKPVIREIQSFKIAPHLHPIRRKIGQFFYNLKLRTHRNEAVYDQADNSDEIPGEESAADVLRSAINPQLGKSIWYHNPWIAGFLSIIIPGLGQMYKEELIKGLIFFVLWLSILILALFYVGAGWQSFAWSTFLSIYAAAILDAITNKIIDLSREEAIWWNIGILIVIILLFMRFVVPNFRSLQIQEEYQLAPYLIKNDRVLISRLPYVFGEPQPGDIVYYAIPVDKLNGNRYRSNNETIYSGGDVIERIIGMPGDTIVLQNQQFLKNNLPLPQDLYPLSMTGITKNDTAEVTVPADSYFIYLSAPFRQPLDAGKRLSGSIISKRLIEGKVVLRYAPFSRWLVY
ncbi:MAG: signal peptidase I [bacterium]